MRLSTSHVERRKQRLRALGIAAQVRLLKAESAALAKQIDELMAKKMQVDRLWVAYEADAKAETNY